MTRTATSIARHPGFTLIEVLAAMVLIAVVVPVAMQAASVALRGSAQARHRQEASMLAESKVNEILAQGDLTTVGTAGDFGEDWSGYRWELYTAVTDFDCYEIIVTVYWPERGAERSYEMTSLLYPTDTTAGTYLSQAGGTP